VNRSFRELPLPFGDEEVVKSVRSDEMSDLTDPTDLTHELWRRPNRGVQEQLASRQAYDRHPRADFNS
jgi:hypothetical protein